MAVVQFVVMALYQRGCVRSSFSVVTYSMKRSRAFSGVIKVR